MNDIHDDRQTVYEVGYLIVASIPDEKVPEEADKVRKIINDAGASIIAEEVPHHQQLAYTIRRKTVSGSYDKYDQAYFGWIKFELGSSKIEAVKKSVEVLPSILRMLLITTVRDNTYLGKRAPAIMARLAGEEIGQTSVAAEIVAPATVEEMDKSIDAMVKEV